MIEQLKSKQPVVFKVLENALKRNNVAHAYLFSGVSGSLQKEMALMLLQSLVCEHANPFGCNECNVCVRIREQNYSDMIVLDGSKTSIKKDEVLHLQEQFALTSHEKYNQKMFVINGAENMTREAMNSLLKFLEEPSNDVIGILISSNPDRLLPTILSRCQQLEFKELSYQDFFEKAQNDLPNLESYMFSKVIKDFDRLDNLLEDDIFMPAFHAFKEFIEVFDRNPDYGALVVHQIIFNAKDKTNTSSIFALYLEMLIVFYSDIIGNVRVDEWYDQSIHRYQNQVNYSHHFKEILDTKKKITRSVNLPLLFDQMIYKIKEEA